ncbi:hypothetical protein CES85_1784 [Ochrobactrum quorumnocens]|uniref:Uncharacterized protein n=1 Tax=Ochrobactrum quorumnocens TaxID=271865 RepID=A0A248UK94_9HYPH|nr:hypothetical protein CES85_1784 [[Ochrobactrum] quorumnocens]
MPTANAISVPEHLRGLKRAVIRNDQRLPTISSINNSS